MGKRREESLKVDKGGGVEEKRLGKGEPVREGRVMKEGWKTRRNLRSMGLKGNVGRG